MFIRDFLYTIKILMRAKVSIFWTLVFPILLATFMYMAFGNIYEQDERLVSEMVSHFHMYVYLRSLVLTDSCTLQMLRS